MSSEQLTSTSNQTGRRLALVVGVNTSHSASLVPLQYAERDATHIAEILQTQFHFELFKPILLGSDASTDTVRDAILKLALQTEKDDVLLLYFSGHGQQETARVSPTPFRATLCVEDTLAVSLPPSLPQTLTIT